MMKTSLKIALLALLTLLASACSRQEEYGARETAPAGSQMHAPAAMLAYEHRLRIEAPAGETAGRMTKVQEACTAARFGLCHILNVWQQGESTSITLRVAPEGVSPLIALASGEGGKVSFRQTSAEDLAQAVQDNRRQTAQLTAYAERMEALAIRPGITVADLIALAREQTEVQQKLEALQKDAAQQQRRIDTHRLEIGFNERGANDYSLTRKFLELGQPFKEGIYYMLVAVLYGWPFLLLLFFIALLWRWAWRRLVRKSP
jgi:hypothetical protein